MRTAFRAIATALALSLLSAAGFAATEGEYDDPHNDVGDTESLQRGARYFVNYCLGCHSAQYVRYNRVAADLGISEEELVENLMFTGERPFDTMTIAMRPEDAERWFGVEQRHGLHLLFPARILCESRTPDRRRQRRAAGHGDAPCAVGIAGRAERRVLDGRKRYGTFRAFRAGHGRTTFE
jgi:hypothetical protein